MRTDLRDNDLIRVRIDDEVRIMGDHDDLSLGLRGDEQRNKLFKDGLGVEILLGLIDDERTIIGVIQCQIEEKKNDSACARRVDLSRICAAPSARLGHVAFKGQGAFASQC